MPTCSHCKIQYPMSAIYKVTHQDQELYFCCKGCENIYFLLHENHLESFYQRLNHQTIKPPKELYTQDLNTFDTQGFLKQYTHQNSDGFREVSLVLEGIHCVACVWLIETALQRKNGIIEVMLNYTNNKLKIIFNLSQISLSQIIKEIRILGYDAQVYDPKITEETHKKQKQSYYFSMIIAIFCTMNIMWIAVAQYAGYFLDISPFMSDILNIASFLLATPVLFWTGRYFYINAYYQLKNKIIGMDLLVSTGAFLTYIYSLYAGISRSSETYFEAVSMIITFVFIGKFLEVQAKKNAGDNLDKLNHMLPTQVTLLKNNTRIQCAPQDVEIGSIIEVLPHEIIAIDGNLLSTNALLNTQNISGESLPILKNKNEEILSGSINTQEVLQYQTTKRFEDSMLFKLVNLLENSLAKKPNIQNLANSLSQYFSKTVLCIAILSFIGWYFIGQSSFEKSLMIAVSVIIISCPCALALATPIASIIGVTEALKHKIIFKETKFLETIARANMICFDKTGTLTLGKPQVITMHTFKDFDLDLLKNLLNFSKHPIANSIHQYLCINLPTIQSSLQFSLDNIKEILGKGIVADYGKQKLFGGNLKFLQENHIDTKNFDLQNYIGFGFGIDKELCAIFLLQDSLKDSAKECIFNINQMIPHVVLLSGDHPKSVAFTANLLNITNYHANLLPIQKAHFIQKQIDKTVIMVGDGFNDALALQQSNVGIAFNTQNNIISLSSDVILLDQSLENLQNTLKIAQKTYKTIRQNITISICYNLLVIPLAISGFIIPLFAALSMSLSSLLVIGNSLRIKKWQKDT